MKLPIWLTAFLLKQNFRRNENMQRYTAHATSEGSLCETKYFYEQVMRTANELAMNMPNLAAMQSYLE